MPPGGPGLALAGAARSVSGKSGTAYAAALTALAAVLPVGVVLAMLPPERWALFVVAGAPAGRRPIGGGRRR
ncbi:hypothetical protein AB0N87_00170 [Streptomyces sp. NPDC093228]|uniref:hypothetical protein n=1 Tax=unclassified Streptomyces TaxID=2593676 RepID=UPI0007411206|nr:MULTISPECIES: hypothetical protein [unclassified Streptomyces]KUJ53575.1 hypothetical protein ADL25_07845 [Streptomyces sp. NRRL F-5122]MDX3264533.1 hypothetical protein [Streptomyces sp. MI02-2A]